MLMFELNSVQIHEQIHKFLITSLSRVPDSRPEVRGAAVGSSSRTPDRSSPGNAQPRASPWRRLLGRCSSGR